MRILLLFIILLSSCVVGNEKNVSNPILKQGSWKIEFDIKSDIIPINFTINNDGDSIKEIIFNNAEEKIRVGDITMIGDSLIIDMPLYSSRFHAHINSDTSFSGVWNNYGRSADYIIPFKAQYGLSQRFFMENTSTQFKEKWRVSFSPDSEDQYNALGLFKTPNNDDNKVYGTFLTETGDYRYLEGNISSDSLFLSCFDGSHLFLFRASIRQDTILSGMFMSGTHWKEPWTAIADDKFSLRNPDDITRVINDYSWKDITLLNMDSSKVSLSNLDLDGSVIIIQIMGSWCPNCIDESRYFKELYKTYNKQGLKIIPVFFENPETAFNSINKTKSRLDLPYDVYLGGSRSSKAALELFPMLNRVSSGLHKQLIISEINLRKTCFNAG